MDYDRITSIAGDLKNNFDTYEAAQLCNYLDILISYMPLGIGKTAIKGMLTQNRRCATITINSDYPPEVQNIVCFHEIGHYLLKHRPDGAPVLYDTCVMQDPKTLSSYEVEANTFAAEYLLDDSSVLDVLRDTSDYSAAASILHVPVPILCYKLRVLEYYHRISKIRSFPSNFRSDCMGRLGSTILKAEDN